jgi:hypothetical protein
MVFDAYLNRTIHSWTPGGMRNPLAQLKLWIVRRMLAKFNAGRAQPA